MITFHSIDHKKHNPKYEVFEAGKLLPYHENEKRMSHILARLKLEGYADYLEPTDFGLEPILEVHDKEFVTYLSNIWNEWKAYRDIDPIDYPSTDYIPATFCLPQFSKSKSSLFHKGGIYTTDLCAAITEHTFEAAVGSVNCALSASKEVLTGEKFSLALSRPPGHHAGRNFHGGYCYLNNAAVAANYLSKSGKVALLDIDYHAFNGTQDIFYERSDVFTVSLHGNPSFEYPYFSGFSDEVGSNDGEGFNLNIPYRKGVTDLEYFIHLEKALKAIADYDPKYLVLSAGVDTFEGDPNGTAKIPYKGLIKFGKMIKELSLPTVIIFEGGYAIDDLGKNFVGLVNGLVR